VYQHLYLEENEVLTAWLQLDVSEEMTDHYWRILRDEERDRIGHLSGRLLVRRTIVRLALRRIAIADVLGIEVKQVEFATSTTGRPILRADSSPSLNFSSSSCGGSGLLALCRTIPIGIDVESVDEIGDLMHFSQWLLSENELEWFDRLGQPLTSQDLLRLWTRKEALLKALGTGIVDSMTSLSFPVESAHEWRMYRSAEIGSTWQYQDLRCPLSHLAATIVVGLGRPSTPAPQIRSVSL